MKNIKKNKKNKNSRQLPNVAPRRHCPRRLGTAIFFLVLIIIAAIILYNLFQPVKFQVDPSGENQTDNTTSEITEPENVKGETKDMSKEDKNNEADEGKTVASDGTPLKSEGEDPNKLTFLTGVITYADAPNGILTIRTNIDQYLSSGTCKLILTSNTTPGISYIRQANIIPSVTTSTCDGFDFGAGEISSGNYSIKIEIDSGEKSGTLTGEVNL